MLRKHNIGSSGAGSSKEATAEGHAVTTTVHSNHASAAAPTEPGGASKTRPAAVVLLDVDGVLHPIGDNHLVSGT